LTFEEEIMVMDRSHPVAVLSAYVSQKHLTVIPPSCKPDMQKLKDLCSLIHPSGTLSDPLEFLLESRLSR